MGYPSARQLSKMCRRCLPIGAFVSKWCVWRTEMGQRGRIVMVGRDIGICVARCAVEAVYAASAEESDAAALAGKTERGDRSLMTPF